MRVNYVPAEIFLLKLITMIVSEFQRISVNSNVETHGPPARLLVHLPSDTQHTQIQTESAKVPRAGHFYPLIHPPTRTYPSSHPLTYPSAHSAHPPTDRKHPSQSKPSELTPGFGSWLRVRLEFSINVLPVLKAADLI